MRRAADEADLLVTRVPSGLDAATGLQPLRAARLADRPTLVVRTPANVAYRRVLVATPPEGDAEHMLVPARAMVDGKELPASAPLQSAAALLGRERQLFPDLVVLPCVQAPSIARRFLSLTKADTLLLPDAAAGVSRPVGSAGFGHSIAQPVLSEAAP